MNNYTGNFTPAELKSLRRVGINYKDATFIRFCTGHDAQNIVLNIHESRRQQRWYRVMWRSFKSLITRK